jgi:photosystem II stability/assembly factor-like uncharacterized protein
MKIYRSSIASLCVAAALIVAASAPAAAALRAVTFVSPSTGWVAGDGIIAATTDGGRTWHQQYSGRVQISSLSFVSASTGWAAGLDPLPGTGVLLGTRDGGHTWSKLAEPPNTGRIVSFGDSSVGYAMAGGSLLESGVVPERSTPFFGGRLAQSTDGGASWHVLDNPMLVDTVCAGSSRSAFAAYQAAVLRANDGASFNHVFSPHIDTHLVWYASVHCAGDDVAWVQFSSTPVGDQRPWIVFRTTDSGQTWQPMLMNKKTPAAYFHPDNSSAADAPGPWPGPFAVVDGNTAFFIGGCPQCGAHGTLTVTGTIDGGATWQPIATVPDLTLAGPVSVWFADRARGWVVGTATDGSPAIEMTANGGLAWTRQKLK